MDTIKISEFDWIKSNSDLFKKHLYHQYDFQGKKITHLGINITFPEKHIIIIDLCKAKKPFRWLTINGSHDKRRVIDYATIHFSRFYAKNKSEHEPKEVRLIKSEYTEKDISKLVEILIKQKNRDNILNDILQ